MISPGSTYKRLQSCLRPDDMVARLGGDEFAILVDDIDNLSEAISVAKRLQKDISKPLQLGSQEVYPSISIGIASSQLKYKTVEEILRDADIAMYNAKKMVNQDLSFLMKKCIKELVNFSSWREI